MVKYKPVKLQNNNTIGIGLGSGGINGGFGVYGGIPIGGKKLNEEFTIEFVNAENNTLFWEAILNSTIKEKRKPEQKALHFKEIISTNFNVFEEFMLKVKNNMNNYYFK